MKSMTKYEADAVLVKVDHRSDGCVASCRFADARAEQAAMDYLRDQDCIFFRCTLSGDTFVYFPQWHDAPIPGNECSPTPMLLRIYNVSENEHYHGPPCRAGSL